MLLQPQNVPDLIEVTFFGIINLVIKLLFKYKLPPLDKGFASPLRSLILHQAVKSEIYVFTKLLHSLNAFSPIKVTLLGIATLSKLLHPLNASLFIVSVQSENVIAANFSHPEKPPTFVNPFNLLKSRLMNFSLAFTASVSCVQWELSLSSPVTTNLNVCV